MTRKVFLFLLCLLLWQTTVGQEAGLRSGDLLFVDAGEKGDAMEQAVSASTGNYTHVALVERDVEDRLWVIEAVPGEGVRRVDYGEWKCRQTGRVDCYRLTVAFDTAAVLTRAKALVGKPYDEAFLPDNGAYYCSELVAEVYGLFEARPMNWRDARGRLPRYWKRHFNKLKMAVPEGVPGTNPADMSRSPLLRRL